MRFFTSPQKYEINIEKFNSNTNLSYTALRLVEHEENSHHQTNERCDVIPMQRFAFK